MKSNAAIAPSNVHYLGNVPFQDPLLRRYLRQLKAGQALFQQGDVGKTLFIIAEGIVQLTATRDEQELFISELHAGHVLGEKALVGSTPHKRFFGARAKTDAVVLELSSKDMEDLEEKNPSLVIRVYERIGKIAVERLDRIDHMIKVLRPANNVERLVYVIIHFCHFEGHKTKAGIEVHLPMDTIRYYISMTPFDIDYTFAELHKKGILINKGQDNYCLAQQSMLIDSIPYLKDNLPSLTAT